MKNQFKGSLVGALLLAAACGAVSSCNLVVVASGDACETDEDCINLPNTACDTEQGSCVSVDKCQSNAECGPNEVCRAVSPRTCVPLLVGTTDDPGSPYCLEIFPDDGTAFVDGTMLIGITAPLMEDLTGEGNYTESSTGFSITNAAKLAVMEINEKGGVNGVNKLALVICDDHGHRGPAEENGRSLAKMGVQVVIGPAFSGQTQDTATGTEGRPGTVANDVLILSTSATSPDITGIPDVSPRCLKECGNDTTCSSKCPGLVWRTSPSDRIQGDGLNLYFKEDLEEIVKNRTTTPETIIDVTILHKGDPYGVNLADFVRTGLEMNGTKATDPGQDGVFKVRNYGDTSVEGVTPSAAEIAGTIDDAPDAIFLIGTNEVAAIMQQIETQWSGAADARPYYILADGGVADEVLTLVNTAPNNLRARVRGSVPGKIGGNFTDYSSAYSTTFTGVTGGPGIFGAAGAYDAIYLLTYAATSSGTAPFRAEALALGLARTADVSGTVVNVGKGDFGPAGNALQGGQSINFEGASGPLDFDVPTGEAPSDIQIWCVKDAKNAPFIQRWYHPGSTGMPKGMYGTPDSETLNCAALN
jgi:branched-chain amino acid transport system substrate-binding protein